MYSISEISPKLCCYITLLVCVKPLGVTQFMCHQVECSDIQRHACDICKLQYTVSLFFYNCRAYHMVHPHDMIFGHAFGMGDRERSRCTNCPSFPIHICYSGKNWRRHVGLHPDTCFVMASFDVTSCCIRCWR